MAAEEKYVIRFTSVINGEEEIYDEHHKQMCYERALAIAKTQATLIPEKYSRIEVCRVHLESVALFDSNSLGVVQEVV